MATAAAAMALNSARAQAAWEALKGAGPGTVSAKPGFDRIWRGLAQGEPAAVALPAKSGRTHPAAPADTSTRQDSGRRHQEQEQAGPEPHTAAGKEESLERLVQALQDPSAAARQRAAQQLQVGAAGRRAWAG